MGGPGGIACNHPEGQVYFVADIAGIEDLLLNGRYGQAIKEAVVAELGSSIIPTSLVDVTFQQTGRAEITVNIPRGVTAVAMKSTLTASSTIASTIKSKLAEIHSGPLKIVLPVEPVVKAVFCGDLAETQLSMKPSLFVTPGKTDGTPPGGPGAAAGSPAALLQPARTQAQLVPPAAQLAQASPISLLGASTVEHAPPDSISAHPEIAASFISSAPRRAAAADVVVDDPANLIWNQVP